MRPQDTVAVLTTVGDMDAARALARTLVERRLAACVQLSAIESFYRWDGAVQHAPEVRLLCKTSAAAAPALRAAIVELHPTRCPRSAPCRCWTCTRPTRNGSAQTRRAGSGLTRG
ncbi:MAG: divalent-cation tolerance protein CutA [Pseudorhodoferax sp.]